MRRPRPKFKISFLFIFLLFLNKCYSNKHQKKKYKESFLIVVYSWNRDWMLMLERPLSHYWTSPLNIQEVYAFEMLNASVPMHNTCNNYTALGSKWHVTQIWETDVFRLDSACSAFSQSFEQKHSSFWKTVNPLGTRPHQNVVWYNNSWLGCLKILNYVPKEREKIYCKKWALLSHR